jgi:hypothetical protein
VAVAVAVAAAGCFVTARSELGVAVQLLNARRRATGMRSRPRSRFGPVSDVAVGGVLLKRTVSS